VIGLPPILNYGSPALKAKVVPEVLQAKKFICLAVSEPFAGSDVGGLRTTAVKSEDGKEWIVNGTKKYDTLLLWYCGLRVIDDNYYFVFRWITNGQFCDYFVVGTRTDVSHTYCQYVRWPDERPSCIREGSQCF